MNQLAGEEITRVARILSQSPSTRGVQIHSRLALGGVVAAAGVQKSEETVAFHRTQGLVEGGHAQSIEFDGGFTQGGAHWSN